jgi:hypothetical protein
MAEIPGKNVNIYIDYTGVGDAFDQVVCQTEGSLDINTPINRTQTNCGSKVATGVPEVSISGTFLAETAPDTDQTSLQQLLAQAINPTLVKARAEYDTDNTKFFIQGDAYVTAFGSSWTTDGSLEFNATFEFNGTPVLVEPE